MNSLSPALPALGVRAFLPKESYCHTSSEAPLLTLDANSQNWIQLVIAPIGKVLEEKPGVGFYAPWAPHIPNTEMGSGSVLSMDWYCHSFSEDPLWKLESSWIHSVLKTFKDWSHTKASRTESCCWLLPPQGSLLSKSPALALCASLPKERCCHPLSGAQHWNTKLSSKTEHVQGLLPYKGFQENKIFLAVNSPWHLIICTTNNGAGCFPSQGKVIWYFRSSLQNLETTSKICLEMAPAQKVPREKVVLGHKFL